MAEATSEDVCVERHEDYPYDVWEDSMDSIQRQRLETMFAYVQPGESLLDVGCNSGYAKQFVSKRCLVWGVDVSEALVSKARQRLDGAEVARAESLPFRDGTFDVVALGEILEHVFDPVLVLREAARVSRRAIIGSTPTEDGAWGSHRVPDHPFHVRCYDETTLRADLETVATRKRYVTVKRLRHMYVFEALV